MRRLTGMFTGVVAVLAMAGCGSGSSPSARAPTSVEQTASASLQGPFAVPSSTAPSQAPTTGGHSSGQGGGTGPGGLVTGNLGVKDQSGDGSTITVGAAEIDGLNGWLAIQRDDHGRPGSLEGLVARRNEQHDDIVTIRLRHRASSGLYWATVHIDAGRAGKYEYPGPDAVLKAGTQVLSRKFRLTVS